MTAQPTTPWGQTLKTAARMGQEKRGSLVDPMPGFFHQKPTPEGKGQTRHSHEVDAQVKTLVQVKQRAFSPEFMRAITLDEGDDLQSAPVWSGESPRQRPATYPETQDGSPDIQQGVVFRMNRFSLVALIVGLLLLGFMFFAGGIMLAFNFSSQEANQGPAAGPQQAQDHSRAIHATRELVTLLPAGAQGTVSTANQVGNVAQTVAVPAPGSPAPAALPQPQVASGPQGAPVSSAPQSVGQPQAGGAVAAPPPALGAMPGARSSAAAPLAHPAGPAAPPVAAASVAPPPSAAPAVGSVAPSAPVAPGSLPVSAAPAAAPAAPMASAPPPASSTTAAAPLTSSSPIPVHATQAGGATVSPVAQAPAPVPASPVAPALQQTSTPMPAAAAPGGSATPHVAPALGAPGATQPASQQKAALEKPVDATALTRPFALQVGAYPTVEKAQQVVALLHRRGYNAYVVSLPQSGQSKDFAVRMGGYFTRQSALIAADHLMRKERFKIMAIAKNNAERVIL